MKPIKHNARTKHWVNFRGIEIGITQLAKLNNQHPSTLMGRVHAKWNLETALFAPVNYTKHTTNELVAQMKECKAHCDKLEIKVREALKPKRKPGRPKKYTTIEVPVVANVNDPVETLIQYVLKRIKEAK